MHFILLLSFVVLPFAQLTVVYGKPIPQLPAIQNSTDAVSEAAVSPAVSLTNTTSVVDDTATSPTLNLTAGEDFSDTGFDSLAAELEPAIYTPSTGGTFNKFGTHGPGIGSTSTSNSTSSASLPLSSDINKQLKRSPTQPNTGSGFFRTKFLDENHQNGGDSDFPGKFNSNEGDFESSDSHSSHAAVEGPGGKAIRSFRRLSVDGHQNDNGFTRIQVYKDKF